MRQTLHILKPRFALLTRLDTRRGARKTRQQQGVSSLAITQHDMTERNPLSGVEL